MFSILLVVAISSCIPIVQNQSLESTSTESPCVPLLEAFDNHVGKGITGIDGVVVGGILMTISEPEYVDYNGNYPADYVYTLTFQGGLKQATFKFYSPHKITIPLTERQVYQFELLRAYGKVTSMEPHNSMFSADQIDDIFEPLQC